MEVVVVEVPNDVVEGKFMCEYNGKYYEIACPDGCGPGTELDVHLPEGGLGKGRRRKERGEEAHHDPRR